MEPQEDTLFTVCTGHTTRMCTHVGGRDGPKVPSTLIDMTKLSTCGLAPIITDHWQRQKTESSKIRSNDFSEDGTLNIPSSRQKSRLSHAWHAADRSDFPVPHGVDRCARPAVGSYRLQQPEGLV